MAFQTNSLNFPNLTVKGAPTTSDLLLISDQAAGGVLKQSPISGFPPIGVQQVTQYSPALYNSFSGSFPGLMGGTQSDSITQTMGTLLNSSVVFIPFYISTAWSMTKMYVEVKTGLASSTITMGVYASTVSNGGADANLPTSSALGVGSVATGTATTGTVVNASVSASLSANTLYWAAIQTSSAATLAITVGALCFGPQTICSANGASTAMVANLVTYSNAYSAGTLPAITQSSLTLSQINYCPIINCQ